MIGKISVCKITFLTILHSEFKARVLIPLKRSNRGRKTNAHKLFGFDLNIKNDIIAFEESGVDFGKYLMCSVISENKMFPV